MSKKTQSTAPTTLPDDAKAIYAAAFNHVPSDNVSEAAKFAWSTVKRAFYQVDNQWVTRDEHLGLQDVNSFEASDNTKRNKDDKDVNYISDSSGFQPCSDCRFFSNRICELVAGDIDPAGTCDLYEPIRTVGSMSVQQLSFNITKASFNKDTQEFRWGAVCSDTDPDSYNEKMSLPLFKDFIERIDKNVDAPIEVSSDFWKGGMPYLGVSHYLDQDGGAVVGPTLEIYIDGKFLKAKGRFENEKNPELAMAAYKTIRAELVTKTPPDDKIRISIAFVDWKHSHDEGDFLFERSDIKEVCPLCIVGVPVYEYLAGQLVHLALTRSPANVRTDMLLEEKSMTTKYEDAESIVGKELADKLDKRAKESLTSKSAVVVKSEHIDDFYTHGGYYSFGGALTITEALEFEEAAQREARMYDLWYMLEAVMENIIYAELDDVPDKAAAMLGAIEDFKSHIETSVLVKESTLSGMLERMKDMSTNTVVQEPTTPDVVVTPSETHVLDPYMIALKTSLDMALANPAAGRENMFEAIQGSINNVAAVMKSAVESATPHETQTNNLESLREAVRLELAAYPALQALPAQSAQASAIPVARALQPGVPPVAVPNGAAQAVVPAAPVVKSNSIQDLVNKSVLGSARASNLRGETNV